MGARGVMDSSFHSQMTCLVMTDDKAIEVEDLELGGNYWEFSRRNPREQPDFKEFTECTMLCHRGKWF